jgi:hypothetical protein
MANTDDTNKNSNDEDNFGLPDIEYKPLDQLDTSKPAEETAADQESSKAEEPQENSYKESPVYEEEEEGGSGTGRIIGWIVVLVVLVGAFLAYRYVYVPKKEKEKMERLAKEKEELKKKAEADSLARVAEAERLKREAEANAKPATGAIETLEQRTGHYFVIISSSIDGDLAMDRAKKLSAKGISSKIIPPFGKWKFYRLGIGDFDSFASAQSSADASKSEYGDALWVMKY